MKKMTRYTSTERLGVNAVDQTVIQKLDWIFREIPTLDFGIDGQIEIVEDGNPQNKLIAVQIKSGSSYLTETKESEGKYFTYYPTRIHYHYWLNSAIPVIGIFRSDEGVLYWQKLSADTIEMTKKGCKVIIPKSNIFDESIKSILEQYYHDWTPKSNYPLLDKNSEFKGVLGIENFLISVQSLKIIKDAINYHAINFQSAERKLINSTSNLIKEISIADQIQLQKMKISIRVLKTRINSELQYLTSLSAELFRSYAIKLELLKTGLSNRTVNLHEIKGEYIRTQEAAKIISDMAVKVIELTNIKELKYTRHPILKVEFEKLVNLIRQLKDELVTVIGFHELVCTGFELTIKEIE